MARSWPGWYCRECGETGEPLTEYDDDGSMTVTCPECGEIEVHRPERGGHRV